MMKNNHSKYIICFMLTFLLSLTNVQAFAGTTSQVMPITTKLKLVNSTINIGETNASIRNDMIKLLQENVIAWKSLNTNVAKVDWNGNITGVNEGETKIVATTIHGEGATCLLTVKSPGYKVTSVKLNKDTLNLTIGNVDNLAATVFPATAINKSVIWSSSATRYAAVDSNGNVKGIDEGTAYISAITKDGAKVAICKVTVKKPVKATLVLLNKNIDSINVGCTDTLTATVFPTTVINKTVIWMSSDAKIARVDDNGIVTGVSEGDVKISASTTDGAKTSICSIKVINPQNKVSLVRLNKGLSYLTEGSTDTLLATVTPASARNKTLIWASSNDKIAKLTNGVVTAVTSGMAIISVTSVDGNKVATCYITVIKPIILNKTMDTLKLGSNEYLNDLNNCKGILWKSSNPSVASVNSIGKVTALSHGTTIITAQNAMGGIAASCKITVVDK